MKILSAIIKIAIFIAIIVAFFYVYNTYLVDRSIEDLELSLTTNSYAQSVGDMRSLNFFLDEVFMRELTREKIDEGNLSQLEFAQSIVFNAKDYRQIEDVQFFLDRLAEKKESQRGRLLRWLDQLIAFIKSYFAPEVTYRQRVPKPEEDLTVDMGLLNEARRLDDDWKLDKAIQAYESFLKQYPTYYQVPSIMLDLGYVYLKKGDYEKAEELFKRVKKVYPQDIESMLAKMLLKRLDEIRAYERERLRLAETLDEAKPKRELQKDLINMGILSYKMFDYGSARDAFEQAVKVYPEGGGAPRSLFYLGLVLKSHKLYDAAVEAYERLVTNYPNSELIDYARYQIADIYQIQGKYELAISEFERLAQDKPQTLLGNLAQFRAGYIYQYDLGDSVRANRAFQKLRQMKAAGVLGDYGSDVLDSVVGEGYLGYAFQNLIQYRVEEAGRAFEKVIEMNETNAWAHSGLGENLLVKSVLTEENKEALTQEALDRTSLGMKLLPDDSLTLAARGFVVSFAGDIDEAIEYYKKALSINPFYDVVWYNLGCLYMKKNDYKEARRCFKKALEYKPNFAAAYNNLGYMDMVEGKQTKAVALFTKACNLDSRIISARFNLARIFEEKYNYEKAIVLYREVLKVNPDSEEARSRIIALQKMRKVPAGETQEEKRS